MVMTRAGDQSSSGSGGAIIGPRSRVRPSEGAGFFALAFGLRGGRFRGEAFFFATARFGTLRLPATGFLRAVFFTARFFAFFLVARLVFPAFLGAVFSR
jgi:hypothetical protein